MCQSDFEQDSEAQSASCVNTRGEKSVNCFLQKWCMSKHDETAWWLLIFFHRGVILV